MGIAAAVFALVVVAMAWMVGTISARPAAAVIGAAPADLPVEAVAFDSASGSRLSGWFVPGRPGQGAVILMHGVRANRLEMLDRARFLHRAGFAVLLFDFQASGESPGRAITFGYLESRDARAAFDYLRRRLPGERIGVIGMSMGGAAALLSEPPLEADAMVLEAVFATFEDAVMNRLQLYFGTPGRWLQPGLTWQIKLRLGFDAEQLQPVARIGRLAMPMLLIAGEADQHATLAEMKQLFERAKAPKELWVVAGARHQDLHRFAQAEYERRLLGFLAPKLRR
jgi:uncharacterized protein